MKSVESSSNTSTNGSSHRAKRPSSSRASVTKSRRGSHVTVAPLNGSMSSPLAPSNPGLTPQKVRRRASSQLSLRDNDSAPCDLLSYAGEFQGPDSEMDTPSKRPGSRLRSASSASSCAFESSALRQDHTQQDALDTDEEPNTASRPVLEKSQTSPGMHAEAERLQRRPDLPARGASDPVSPKPKTNIQINRDLMELIRKGPSTKKKYLEEGSTYLLRVKSATADVELLKIGQTQQALEKRMSQIRSACRPVDIQEHKFAVAENIPFYGFAEALAHAELANFQHHWGCTCRKKHKEYFNVSEDLAKEVFIRWREFCKQRPWSPDGKLSPTWEQRLKNKPRFSDGEHDSDHWELARHWSIFTSPTAVELAASDAIRIWNDFFPERWQFVAIAELLTIICISPVSFWITTWAVVIGSLLLIDLVATDDLHIFRWIAGLMRGGLQAFRSRAGSGRNGRDDRNRSPSLGSHGMQTPTPSERPARGLDNIIADTSPGAYPCVSPGATDCESDMEDEDCSSPCAGKAFRRLAPDIRVDHAIVNSEIVEDKDSDVGVVNG